MMKKAIACAAALTLVFAQPYTVMCAETSVESQATETQSVILAVKDDITVTNGMVTIEYDSEQLIFEEFRLNDALKKSLSDVNTNKPGVIIFGFAVTSPVKISESLAEIVFSGSGSVSAGVKSMTVNELVTENEKGEDVKLPAETLKLVTSGGESETENPEGDSSYEKYDMNQDGIISTADIIKLSRMIAGIDEKTDAADINADGKVDAADILELVNVIKGN